MISLAFILLGLTWFLWGAKRREWDPFAPARLYGTIWFLSIGITNLRLSDIQMTWTALSWVCVLGSVLAYLAGVTLAGKPIFRRGNSSVHVIAREVVLPRPFLRAAICLYFVCLSGYLWRVHIVGTIPAFAENVEEARWGFYDIENGSTFDRLSANLAFLFSSIMVLCVLFLLVRRKRDLDRSTRRLEVLVLVLLASAVLFLVSTTFRGAIIPPLIVIAGLYHYLRMNIRVWKLVTISALGICLGVGIVVYRHLSSSAYSLETAYTLAEMKIPPEYAIVAEPYSYVALSIDNVVRLFEQSLRPTLGILSFRPLWTVLGLKQMLLSDVNLPFQPAFGFNTATYLFPFYEDFGIVGILVFPFSFGWVSGKLYSAMLTKGKLVHLVGYCYVMVLIVFSVLDNLFVFMRFWVEIGVVCAVLYAGRESVLSSLPRAPALPEVEKGNC